MTEYWVIDASPLILLGKLRRLDLLETLAPGLHVPQTVFNEVQSGVVKDSAVHLTLDWADSRRIADLQLVDSIIRWNLGPGESQVIAHALSGGYRAVLDDGRGRACALAHLLPIIGSLGIILRAKERGLVPTAKPLVEQLRMMGSFLDDELVAQVLAMVGEV